MQKRRKEKIGEFRAGKTPLQFYNERKNLKYFAEAEKLAKEHFPNAESYLDVGGGCSLFLTRFTGKRTVADIDPNGNLYTPQMGVEYVVTDGALTQFEDNSIDIIFCLQVIEHESLNADELFRVAKEAVIISYPYKWKTQDVNHSELGGVWLRERVRRQPVKTVLAADRTRRRSINLYVPPFDKLPSKKGSVNGA